jgi:hypothetical protein
MDKEFSIGETVMVKKLGWNFGDNEPLQKVDVEGTITSIKGISELHKSVHKYEVTWEGGKFYNNGDKLNKLSTKVC